jgi:hypothetical protein
LNYSKGGGVSATVGAAPASRGESVKKKGEGIPFLKIMIAIVVLVLLGLAWLVLTGH